MMEETAMWLLARTAPAISRACRFGTHAIAAIIFAVTCTTPSDGRAEAEYVPNELVVKFKTNLTEDEIDAIVDAEGAQISGMVEVGPSVFHILRLAPGQDVPDLVRRFNEYPDVESAEPNYIGHGGHFTPNDTFFDQQWFLDNIGQTGGTVDADIDAPEGWQLTRGRDTVIVAVLDTGIEADHPEFQGRLVPGFDFVNEDADPEADHFHGVAVSGILAANADNATGGTGIDHHVSIMSVKVLNQNNRGTVVDLVQGLNFAATEGADVISMSLINYPTTSMLNGALQFARDQGATLIACAGNGGIGNADVSGPGASPLTISVGATDDNDTRAGFSGTGSALDVVAPGVRLPTVSFNGGPDDIFLFSGCSAATPVVAGVATLLLSIDPSLSHDQIRDILIQSAEDQIGPPGEDTVGRDDFFGHGRVNMHAALSSIYPVDLDFLVDLSGSFSDDLPVFQAQAPIIVEELKAEFPSIRFGLGRFEDYPIPPFGDAGSGDVAYARVLNLTADSEVFLSVVDGLFTRFGGDGPQSQVAALFQAATGAGQDLSGVGFPGASIPTGQQANFRDRGAKIFLLWTDASFHLPGDPGAIPYPGPSFSETIAAVLALDPPQVIGVSSGGGGLSELQTLAMATGAVAPEGGVDCDNDGVIDIPAGEPLVCPIASSGVGIGEAVIAAVTAGVETGISDDADSDGIPDDQDECPASNLGPTVIVVGVDTGVSNILTTSLGCTIADLIAQAAADAAQRTEFIRNVSLLTRALLIDSLITRADAGAIRVAAAQASFPPLL